MEALATLNNQRQFDFQNNGIEVMDLETLQRTYKENDIYGNPVRGIYHYQVIQRMTDICRRHNLNYEVEEIFAAQNKNRTQPGVVILPQVEQTYGEKKLIENKTKDIILVFVGIDLRTHLVRRCPYFICKLLLIHIFTFYLLINLF